MKKTISVLLICLLIASALSGCNLFLNFKRTPPPSETAEAPTNGATSSPATAAPTEAPTPAATETPTKLVIGSLDSYVKTAKEATFSFDNGVENTYRLPEVLLDSSDAISANKEIMDRFGEDCVGGRGYSPVISMDYEAYLSEKYLSVLVTAKYEGGNSYGLCYAFDVTNGNKLNSETLCTAVGHDYDKTIAALTANLTKEYDDRYAQLPGNETERAKTLAEDNIKAAKLYLDNAGKLNALVDLYAAVGGGHWVDTFSAE